MGYRSEVIAVFYCHDMKDYPAMKLFIDENIGDTFKEDLTEEESNERKYIKFYLEDVKWYDSYSDVVQFNEFIKAFVELADGEGSKLTWAYEFVRFGEELNDIEVTESDGSNNVMSIHRYVDLNF